MVEEKYPLPLEEDIQIEIDAFEPVRKKNNFIKILTKFIIHF